MISETEEQIINQFHDLYHLGPKATGSVYQKTSWMGVTCFKCPLDMWMYHEIMFEKKPDLIIETGSYKGGSALYLANVMDLLGHGEIISVDIEDHVKPVHDRIQFITGSSIDEDVVASIRKRSEGKTIMVILDSNHASDHVLAELACYAPMVTSGQYLIVEDTNLNGHPTYKTHGPGPWEAVEEFMRTSTDFEIDKSRERFLLTFNPSGYLLRT